MADRQHIGVPGADKAYQNLLRWLAREEWRELCATTIDEHLGAVCDEFDLNPEALEEELGPDVYGVVMSCAIEDSLTRRSDDGVNPVDDYLKRRGWRESAPGRRYLEALRDSVMSLYEVVDLVPGSHLVLRDMVQDGEPIRVDDRLGSEKVVIWDRLAARVIEAAGRRVLANGVLPFEFEAAEAEAERVRDTCRRGEEELAKHAQEEGGRPPPREAIAAAVLSHWAPHFTQAWLVNELAEESPEERTNADGEPLVLAAVRFPRRAEMAAIAARLDAEPTLARNEAERESDDVTWDWRRSPAPTAEAGGPAGEEAAAAGEQQPLGLAVLNENGVVLLTNSAERAERGRSFLAGLLGDLVGAGTVERFPLDEPPVSEEATGSATGAAPPPGAPAAGEAIDPGALAEKVRAANDEAYRRMLTEPAAELDGKTPQDAAADEAGRERLVTWLKRLENDDAHLARVIGVPPYDFRWMWAELGIADRRR